MTDSRLLRILVALVTTAVWVLPNGTFGGEALTEDAPTPERSAAASSVKPVDVAIGDDGRFGGSLVDDAGVPLVGVTVYLMQGTKPFDQVQTDERGSFAFELEQGGFYEVVVNGQTTLLRCWAPTTAPPSARRTLLVSVGPVERGQIHPAASALANPWIITGVVAAAIIIPVAIHNNRSDRKSASD